MDQTLVLAFGRKGSGKSTLLRALALRALRSGDRRVVIWDNTREWSDPPEASEEELERWIVLDSASWTAEQAARRALELAPAVLVLDEVDRVLPNALGMGWGDRLPNLYAVVHCGRHYKVALLAAARRLANVHQDVVALADVAYAFSTTLARDLERLEREYGPEVAAEVAALPPHQFVRYDL